MRVDDVVVAGQEIGYSGNTGFSTGPHLHFACVQSGREQGTFPSAPCDLTWGASGTGLRMSGRPSTGTIVCGIRPSQECMGADTQGCGNCGMQTRSCNTESGQWTPWGSCVGSGACSPGQTRTCAGASSVTCTASCMWPPCGACVTGATESQRCGNCGTQTHTCMGTEWSPWGRCTAEGMCSSGQTRTCVGACGSGTQACTSSCNWGACSAPSTGACTPGATQTCTGACGTGAQTCTSSCTWGVCSAPSSGACVPGATRTCTGACGSGTQTCTASCAWGACSAPTSGACVPGATQSCIGACGTGTQTCTASCAWGACSAPTSGACSPGQTRTCSGAPSVTCSGSCSWPACPNCNQTPTLQAPSNGAAVSAGRSTTFRWTGDTACYWEVKARWCCVSGNCDVSAGDRDAGCPEVFHLHNVTGNSTAVTLPSQTGAFRWLAQPEGQSSLAPQFFIATAR